MSAQGTAWESDCRNSDLYLYAEAGFHEMKLIHQFLVQGPHVLRYKLLMHCQPKLQYVSLMEKR